jgi:hypothetical protein
LKREEICDQIAAWIADAAGSPKKHLTALNVIQITNHHNFLTLLKL